MPKKIVLIEDDKNLRPMYVEKFTMEGFEVAASFDAEEGLSIIKQNKPDIVLLDILLPKEDGINLLRKMRKDKSLAKIPVVVFSNLDNPYVKKEAQKLGVLDYLIKTNFTPRQIVDWIKKYFSQNEGPK